MSGDSQFDHQTNQYFWRLVPPDADEGYSMAAWATKHGYTRAAAVFASGSQSQADGPSSQAGFKALGGKIVTSVSLTPGQPSYSTEAAQVAGAHPQVIFYDAGAPESATFLAELKQQMGKLPPTYVVETEEEPGWIKAVTGAIGASGLSSFTAFEAATPASTQPGWQTFSHALGAVGSQVSNSNQYLHDPFTLSYYDASNLVALAMLEAHSTTPADFNKDIMGLTQPGAGKTVVNSFAAGKKALAAGKQIQYVGALGAITLDKYHNIATPFIALTEGANPKEIGAVPTNLMVKAAGDGRLWQSAGGLRQGMNSVLVSLGFGIITASTLLPAAVGFTLQFSATGVLNIAFGAQMTFAAFIAYVCTQAGLNIWVAMVAAGLFGAVTSALLNRFMLTPFARRGTTFFGMIVVTIALALLVEYTVELIWGPLPVSYPLTSSGSCMSGPSHSPTRNWSSWGSACCSQSPPTHCCVTPGSARRSGQSPTTATWRAAAASPPSG